MKGALIFLINYLNHHQFNTYIYKHTVKSTEPTRTNFAFHIFSFRVFLSFFLFVCQESFSLVVTTSTKHYLNTTDTNLSRRSIFYFKLLSFTLFAVIDSAHIPQIVIAAIIIFNIHSALKNLKKVQSH